ncbi:MAG: diacylglycerol kinase family protein [Vicinamibacterales bacterium]
MRILIYQNPEAGHEAPRPEALIQSLQRAGHDVEWRHIKKHRLSDPDTGPLDLVVAVGGDGSVGRTARQLIGGELPIAVLPMGTANNLASVLDAGAHDLAERIASWRLVPFDAGTLEGCGEPDWFFEGLGLGAFADTAARLTEEASTAPPQPSREAELARDLDELTKAVRDQRPIDLEVAIDGKTIQTQLLMLEILNIGRLGPGVELAGGVDPTDGALDVVMVEERHRAKLVAYLEALKTSGSAPSPFRCVRTTSVRVRSAEPVGIHIDGRSEDVRAPVELTVGVRRHAVRFLGGPA